MVDATPGLLTSLNTGSFTTTGGTGERVLIDYKDAILDYKVTDLPVMQFFADSMKTDTGGNIDITFAKPSMKMEEIDEGSTPQYQHTKLRSERVSVKEWGIAVGVTRRMIEDSRFNEVEMALNEARRAVDRHLTQHIVKVVFGGTADSTLGTVAIDETTSENTITNFGTNIYSGFFGTGMTSFATGTSNLAGRLDQYADQTVTEMIPADTSSYVDASSTGAGSISLTDISAAISRMARTGYKATHLFLSPKHYENLLKLADFASVFTTSSATAIVSGGNVMPTAAGQNPLGSMLSTGGIMGNLYGLTVVVNAWVPQGRMGIFDLSTKPMAYVERRPLTVEEANPGFGIVGSYMSMRYGLKVVRPEAGVIVVSD
tara:strand:- start:644 stop:1762 length:1119 start_codon:yes stop_codon:yes gene_type:complete